MGLGIISKNMADGSFDSKSRRVKFEYVLVLKQINKFLCVCKTTA